MTDTIGRSSVEVMRGPLGHHSTITSITDVLSRLREWPVAAQQQARRNAMVAATACAQRRIEREEVDDFLQVHARATGSPAPSATTPTPATPEARAHG